MISKKTDFVELTPEEITTGELEDEELETISGGHLEMRLPPPRRSKYNPSYESISNVDNDLSAPLGPDDPVDPFGMMSEGVRDIQWFV